MRYLRPFLKINLLIGISTWLTSGFGVESGPTGITDPVPEFNQARGFNDSVISIVPASNVSGDIYVGGRFRSYNTLAVHWMARLESRGALN